MALPESGPTIFLQVHTPEQKSARPYHVVVGHAAGVIAAVLGVLVAGAGAMPPVLPANVLTWPCVWASVIAMGLMLLQLPLRVSHPPAAATALLIALGGVTLTPKEVGTLAASVLLVATLGEGMRQLRMRALSKDDEVK